MAATAASRGWVGAYLLAFLAAQLGLLRLRLVRDLRRGNPLLGLLAIETPFSLLAFYLGGGAQSPASILAFFLVGVAASQLPLRELAAYTTGVAVAFTLPLIPPLLPSGRPVQWGYLATEIIGYYALAYMIRYLVQTEERERVERIESEQSLVESKRRVSELTALQRISRQLSSTLELDKLLPLIVEETVMATPAANGGLLLVDERTRKLTPRALYGYTPEQRVAYEQLDFEQANTIIGSVRGTGQPKSIADVLEAADYCCIVPETRSELAVPIRVGNTVVGVLDLEARLQDAFSAEDVRFLEAIADQAAVALSNAQLYAATDQTLARRVEELSAMSEITRQLASTLDLHRVLDLLITRAVQATGATSALAGLYDPETDTLELLAQRNYPTILRAEDGTDRMLGMAGITGRVVRTGKPCLLPDVSTEPDYAPVLPDTRSQLTVPIRYENETLGVLNLESNRKAAFTPENLGFIENLANQAAIAIENARLFTQSEQRVEEMTGLFEIAGAITSTFDLDRLMEETLQRAARLLRAEKMALLLYDEATERLRGHPSAVVGLPPEEAEGFSIDTTSPDFVYGVFVTGKTFRSSDAANDRRIISAYRPLIQKFGFRTVLSVPLRTHDVTLGELHAGNKPSGPFTDDDERLLATIAAQLATGIQNARSYQRTDERLRSQVQQMTALQRIGRELNATLELERILEVVITEAIQATSASHGNIALLDVEAGKFHVVAHQGYTDEEADQLSELVLGEDTSVTDEALRAAKSIIVRDVSKEERRVCVRADTQSAIVVPILYEGQVAGAIDLRSMKPNAFDESTLGFLEGLANQAGVAIGNAWRFQEQVNLGKSLRRRAEQLNSLLEIGNALKMNLSLEEILEQIVYSIQDAVGFNMALLSVVEGDPPTLRRVAASGMPIAVFEEMRQVLQPLARFERIMKDEYRISESYFFPHQRAQDWLEGLHTYTPPSPEEEQWEEGRWHPEDMLIVPLRSSEGEIIGLLSVDDPRDGMMPSRSTIEALEIFANQAAIAVENARLYQTQLEQSRLMTRRAEQLGNLLEFGNDLKTEMDVRQACDQIVQAAHVQMGYNLVALNLVDSEDASLVRVVATAGLDGSSESLVTSQPFPREAVETLLQERYRISQSFLIPGGNGHLADGDLPVYVPELGERASDEWQASDILIVPLSGSKGHIGFLSLDDPTNRKRPEREDIAALEVFANQAAIGIENALLYENLVTRMREISALYDVSRSLVSTLDLESMLLDVLSALERSTGYANCAFLLPEAPSGDLVVHAALGYMEDTKGTRTGLGREGIAGWVGENKQPLVVPDVSQDTRYVQRDSSIRSEAAVPMMVGDHLIGVLDVQSDQIDAFGERDLRILSAVAAQTAVAIENGRLYDETHRRATQLEATSEVGRRITSILGLDDLLTEVVELAHESFKYDHVHVFLVDQDSKEAVYRAGNGSTGQRIREEGLRLKIGQEGMIGQVVATKQPLIANDVSKDPYYVSHPALKSTRSECTVPLIIGERVIGVLDVQSNHLGAFTDDDLFLLQALGDQLAIAIENARLFEESERRIRLLAAMNRMGQTLSSSLDPTALIGEMHKEISQVMDAENFYIALYDEGTGEISFPFAVEHGERQQWEPMRGGNSLTETIVRTREPIFLPEKVMESLQQMGIEAVGDPALSWMGVPMIAGEKAVGVIAVQSYEKPRAYTADDLNLLQTIATQAATAFENARLFQETRQSAEEMRLLYDLGVSLSETLDLDQVLTLIAQSALRVTHTNLATIYVKEHEQSNLTFKVMSDPPDLAQKIAMKRPRATGLTARILESGEVVVIADTARDRRVSSIVKKMGIRSTIGVPIQVEGKTVGVLFAGSLEPHDFTTRELQLVTFLVNQSARAIRNAQLYQEISRLNAELEQRVEQRTYELADANKALTLERDRTDALYRIARELSASLDLNRVMARALQLLKEAIGMSQGSILLLDHRTESLVHRASVGRSEEVPLSGVPTPFRKGVGLAGWVLEHREAIIIPDVSKDRRWAPVEGEELVPRSALAAPLQTGEDVLGVLTLTDPRIGYFSEAHMKLVAAAATQIATAISNAELYRLIQEQADRLGEMLRLQRTEGSKTRSILEGIADGVVVTDAEGQIILFNDAAERILGVPVDVVMGQSVHALPATLESGAEMAARGLAAVSRWAGIPSDAKRLVEERITVDKKVANVRVTPVVMGDELLGTVALFRDIGKEVEAERTKNEFISTVSHELRTPMTSIKGYTDLLFMQAAGPITDNQRKFLSIIKSNADRLAMLVSDLLDISRVETGRIRLDRQPIGVGKVIHDVTAALRKQADEKNLTLTTKIRGKLPPVYADRDRLVQILTNLVDNACRYTPAGGSITVGARRVGDKVQVSVADTGIGIRPEDQERVFERFFRADHPLVQETGGTGLGLAIVKSFIEMHGGTIWLESEVDKGTTFRFTMPVAVLAEPVPESEPIEAPKALSAGKHILVVEDEQDVANLITHYLKQEGYDVKTCARGEDAIAIAKEGKPDLITLDIRLPDRDGFEVLQDLKMGSDTADIPVLILSIVQDPDLAYRLGAVDYLAKPIDEQRLVAAVNSILFSQDLVLICDDDEDTQRLLRQVLERYGFVARSVSDGRQVLAVAEKERPGLILLDLKMPGLDGFAALEELKKNDATRDIPVIIITASITDSRIKRERLLALGAANLMTKPFSIEELVQEVKTALRTGAVPEETPSSEDSSG